MTRLDKIVNIKHFFKWESRMSKCVFCGKEAFLNICHKCMKDADCCADERDRL